MDDKHCSEHNNFVEQEIIKCDDNNAKCLWLLSLILLMKDNSGFCSETEKEVSRNNDGMGS